MTSPARRIGRHAPLDSNGVSAANPGQRDLGPVEERLQHLPLAQAFVYGLFLGPVALPCAGPFLVALLAISVSAAETVGAIATFFAFGLGFGLPLVLISLLARARQEQVVRFLARHHRAIEIVSGILLIGAGVWDLTANWDSVLLTLGL